MTQYVGNPIRFTGVEVTRIEGLPVKFLGVSRYFAVVTDGLVNPVRAATVIDGRVVVLVPPLN